MDPKANISIITLHINELNTSKKKQKLLDWIFIYFILFYDLYN